MAAPTKLPRLVAGDHAWTGTIEMPSWRRFQVRGGAYGSRGRGKRGRARISFARRDDGPTRPTSEQVAAYAYLVQHERAVTKAVLARILRAYPKLRTEYHEGYGIDPDAPDDDDDDDDDLADLLDDPRPLPVIKRAADLAKVMGLATVHVHDVAKAGIAYVGLELGCDWDDEHGAGVMLHKQRIVAMGGADSAILEWIAERDGGRQVRDDVRRPAVRSRRDRQRR